MHILLTGFGPFPGMPRNPSQLVVDRFEDELGEHTVHRSVLPTSYARASAAMGELLLNYRPDICLSLGVATPGPLRIETVAANACVAPTPDCDGDIRLGPIASEGPPEFRPRFALRDLQWALQDAGFEADLSCDAGGYVCNFLFYSAQLIIHRHALDTSFAFVHIPPIAFDDEEDEAVERLVRAVHVVIMKLVDLAKQ